MRPHRAYGNEGYCLCGVYLCPEVEWPGRTPYHTPPETDLTGTELIAAERERQLRPKTDGGEGWDAEHDRGHYDELAMAAVCYALPEERRKHKTQIGMPGHVMAEVRLALWGLFWPWAEKWWKPTPDDRIRELTKAGALIAAAIDSIKEERR